MYVIVENKGNSPQSVVTDVFYVGKSVYSKRCLLDGGIPIEMIPRVEDVLVIKGEFPCLVKSALQELDVFCDVMVVEMGGCEVIEGRVGDVDEFEDQGEGVVAVEF